MMDTITLLRARGGRRMAKTLLPDGTLKDYDSAVRFDAATVALGGLPDLARVLGKLLHRPDVCAVRGALIDPNNSNNIRRLLHSDTETGDVATLRDVPRRWLALDVDDVARPADISATDLLGCAEAAIDLLPSPFWRAGCIVQATAGHGIKPGCRLRLWFWCDRPLTGAEAKRWLAGFAIDPATLNAAQAIYTAAPVIAPGAVDPVPVRLVEYPGEIELQCPPAEELSPPLPAPPVAPDKLAAGADALGYGRAALIKAADAIMNAPEGTRHRAAVYQTASLARLVVAGLLRAADVAAVVGEAARVAGLPAAEINAAIRWGLSHPTAGRVPEGPRHAA